MHPGVYFKIRFDIKISFKNLKMNRWAHGWASGTNARGLGYVVALRPLAQMLGSLSLARGWWVYLDSIS